MSKRKRKYEPGSFVPCSPKHKHCSPAHAPLVAGYRAERQRQELLLEAETNGYEGDIKLWKANGNKLINFKTWLIAHRIQMNRFQMSEMTFTVKQEENTVERETEICQCDCQWCCANDHDVCRGWCGVAS